MTSTDTTKNRDEQQLIERLKKGQQWAFNQLVTQHQERLLKIAYGITLDHEESMEVVQDVFVSVFKNIKNFRQEASLATWLRRITINHCLNWKRKWKRRFKWQHDPIDFQTEKKMTQESPVSHSPETLFREKQFEKKIMDTVKTLPEKLRVVFVLNNLEGLSYEEIADTLDIKMGTVRSRVHSARQKILDSLETNT